MTLRARTKRAAALAGLVCIGSVSAQPQDFSEIEIRSNHGFLIVGIRRADGTNEMNPDPATKLRAGDVVIVLGHKDDIPELANRFSAKKTVISYRGATIER